MFCPNCGNPVNDGCLFCTSCGTKLETQPAPQPAPQPVYEAPVQQPAYEVPAQQQPVYVAPVQQPAYEIPAQQQPVYVAPVQQPAYEIPAQQQPVYVAPVVAPERPQEDPELNSLATNTLIFGIIGLALSEMGIPGIILSSIAMNKAAEFERKAGKLFGKALVGRRLAKPGKIVGIIMTIFWGIYALIMMIAGIASAL